MRVRRGFGLNGLSGITLKLHVGSQEIHEVGFPERNAELAQDRIGRGDVKIEVWQEVIAYVLTGREFAIPAGAKPDAFDLVKFAVTGVDARHKLFCLADVRSCQLHRVDFPRQVLYRAASTPLGKSTRLVARECDLRTERKHVWRETFLQRRPEAGEMLFPSIQDVIQGIESRQEDSLDFCDFLGCHVDSTKVMVMPMPELSRSEKRGRFDWIVRTRKAGHN